MPQGDKPHTDKQDPKPAPSKKVREQKGVLRPEAGARAGSTVNKLHGGGKNINPRQKVPFGPVGGLGRKTNLARSS